MPKTIALLRRVHLPLLFFIALVIAAPARAEKAADLKPQGYVNDFAGALTAQTKDQLTALCTAVDQKAGAQIAVVIIHTLNGVPIEDFSIDLATRWGIGPKQKDRGVLVLLAVDDRQYRVEVGYGLEPILPDGKVGGFGREMVPLLRQGDTSAAVLLLTRRIADVIAQDRGVSLTGAPIEGPPESDSRPPNAGSIFFSLLFLAFFIAFPILGFILRMAMGRGIGGRRGGGWGIGPWIGGMGGGFGGGGFGGGGFGGGGGGFGGFGGGSFGGGGAGGSW
jgi:uncharacterized protein